jgi:hypothetical protein
MMSAQVQRRHALSRLGLNRLLAIAATEGAAVPPDATAASVVDAIIAFEERCVMSLVAAGVPPDVSPSPPVAQPLWREVLVPRASRSLSCDASVVCRLLSGRCCGAFFFPFVFGGRSEWRDAFSYHAIYSTDSDPEDRHLPEHLPTQLLPRVVRALGQTPNPAELEEIEKLADPQARAWQAGRQALWWAVRRPA